MDSVCDRLPPSDRRLRQQELVPRHLALQVVVEEVDVQQRLHRPATPSNPIVGAILRVSIDPVEDVKGPVSPHSANKIGGEVLDFSHLLQQGQLRIDRHALQPDGDGPQDLRDGPVAGGQDTQDGGRRQQPQLVAEGVLFPVVRRRHGRLMPHDVDQVDRADDEGALHHGVVHRDKAPHQVKVAKHEDQGVDLLSPTGHPHATLVLVQLV
mmetsp:Transcript_48580/g.130009  ORF Transcript_48580/g.130009 Transcript_48580/m.130009 type:complete len:210 (-) Transcript_48580:146-775(-)